MPTLILPGLELPAGNWYPAMPESEGQSAAEWTDWILGNRDTLFNHRRGRQCNIGWHNECSNRTNAPYIPGVTDVCACPHHEWARHSAEFARVWNATYPVGTEVALPQAKGERPTTTTGPATVLDQHRGSTPRGVPVVPLAGFDHPVEMGWLVPTALTTSDPVEGTR